MGHQSPGTIVPNTIFVLRLHPAHDEVHYMRLLRRSVASLSQPIDLRAEVDAAWDRLEIHGQGIHSTTDGSLFATEALLRWRRNPNELWAASMVLPIAEETSRVEECTRWATELSISTWATSDRRRHGGRLALNFHGAQLARPELAAEVHAILETYGVVEGELLLEIPDHIGPDRCRTAVDHLGPLVDNGALIALDDHTGTGSATQPSPNWLPAGSIVKLDPGLIMACDQLDGREILERTADGLHAEGYVLVAKAVERPGQLASIIRCRIVWTQGFLLARPELLG
jgi:EAL domain-containing protein (putative c-di-GMP-specific phosphodiesterase class I)